MIEMIFGAIAWVISITIICVFFFVVFAFLGLIAAPILFSVDLFSRPGTPMRKIKQTRK